MTPVPFTTATSASVPRGTFSPAGVSISVRRMASGSPCGLRTVTDEQVVLTLAFEHRGDSLPKKRRILAVDTDRDRGQRARKDILNMLGDMLLHVELKAGIFGEPCAYVSGYFLHAAAAFPEMDEDFRKVRPFGFFKRGTRKTIRCFTMGRILAQFAKPRTSREFTGSL